MTKNLLHAVLNVMHALNVMNLLFLTAAGIINAFGVVIPIFLFGLKKEGAVFVRYLRRDHFGMRQRPYGAVRRSHLPLYSIGL